jgi:hypothetical protein
VINKKVARTCFAIELKQICLRKGQICTQYVAPWPSDERGGLTM